MTLGIDFGTTNSAVAWTDDAGQSHVATYPLHGKPVSTFRSILYFDSEREWERGRPVAVAGPAAIEGYLDNDGEGRLLQSMKTFLASRIVTGTNVFGCDFALERLIAQIIGALWQGARGQLPRDLTGARIVAGRPVRFANSDGDDDDAHAETRLRAAFAAAGFEQVDFVLEPVAAALHYEATLSADETVLVADFGGGTSDFCLLRVGPGHRAVNSKDRIIGTRGIGVAGDDLDARIIQHLVGPALGAGTKYRSDMGNALEIPRGIFDKLRRWNELSFLKSKKNVEMLLGYQRAAVEPKKLQALLHLVQHNLGYRLYRAVEATKVRLSHEEHAELVFADGPIDIRAQMTRADFEQWIAPELEALAGCVDALLTEVRLAPSAIDTVFLTGGTGQVPAVRRLFAERFGEHKLRTGQFLTSIASGLALHARRLDAT